MNENTNRIHEYIASDEQSLVRDYIDLYNFMISGKNSDNFLRDFPVLGSYAKPVKRMTRELVGRDKQLLQLRAGLQRPELCNVLLLGEAGSGKALADDTPIPVADSRGYVCIKDLKTGDYVFDENGKPVKILGVYPQGFKHAYSVEFADKSSIICNDEHLWGCRTRKSHYRNGKYIPVTLRSMIDYGISKKLSCGNNIKSFYIPMNKALERKPADLSLHPYALGVLIGDGCLSGNKCLHISSSEKDVVDRFADCIGAECAVRSSHNYNWMFVLPENQQTDDKKYFQQHDLSDVCDFENVFYTKSVNRRIPEIYLLGSAEQRWDLLHGLMDTDGCVSANSRCNCKFSTNSKGLAEDFQELVCSLGMRATIRQSERNDDVHTNAEYEVYIRCSDEDKFNLFTSEKHLKKLREYMPDKKHYHRIYNDLAVSEVRDLNREVSMTCIYVDSESHLFQAGKEHIVTHNTALVQGAMAQDVDRLYLEVDLARMIADLKDNNEMAAKIKILFDETASFVKLFGIEIVLFIDEFHQIITLSSAAVEALKPMLADSGTRGIRVIVATTFGEFREYVSKNQALIERLQRIELIPPDTNVTVQILKGYAKVYDVADQIKGDYLYRQIVELTNRYVPANSQPRKSILLLDMMVGWYRMDKKKYPMDIKLLHKVIEDSEGVKLDVAVDAPAFKKKLDARVFAQGMATYAVASRLQICAADLNDKTKPMASFIFTGSTGVGKSCVNSTKIPVYTYDNSVHIKQNGELCVGDYVFNRYGKPVKVTGVYPQGKLDVYEVELTDGRKLLCSGEHIWTYKSRFGNGSKNWRNATTKELMQKYFNKYYNNGRSAHNIKFVIPMNQPVQWAKMNYKLHPYVVGTIIGNGCLTHKSFMISSSDAENTERVADLISASYCRKDPANYNWYFYTGNKSINGKDACFQTADILSEIPELINVYSGNKFIPEIYKYGSVSQRWELIKGLFDTDGTISNDDRFRVSYSTSSKQLAYDIQEVLYSLGISSTVNCYKRAGKSDEYVVRIKANNEDKEKFFYISRKRKIAQQAVLSDANKSRIKKFGDIIGIRDIRKLDYQEEMTCIMVDDKEHLYQAGDFIVTHNTELTKAMAEELFGDDTDHLIRFDMTEYANSDSIERFRTELTTKVWEHPYSVILLDEIEKACAEVTRLLLGVLDDGRLVDQNNRVVSFLNCYIVLTTNAAAEVYKQIGAYDNIEAGLNQEEQDALMIRTFDKSMKLIRRAIVNGQGANKFPPELLGRVDEICPFMPLSEETQEKILRSQMSKFASEVMSKHQVRLDYDTEKIIRYILYDKLDTESNSGGARIVKTKFQNEVVKEVARVINLGDYTHLAVGVSGKMAVEDQNKLESDAHIVAVPIVNGIRIENI